MLLGIIHGAEQRLPVFPVLIPFFLGHKCREVKWHEVSPLFVFGEPRYTQSYVLHASRLWRQFGIARHPRLPVFVPLGLVALSAGGDKVANLSNEASGFLAGDQWSEMIPFAV